MFEKLDNAFGEYMEIVDNGKSVVGEFISNSLDGVIQLFLAVFGVLVMVISSPLWLIGKLSAQQSVHPTDGGLAQADSESNPPAISG